MRSAFGHAWGKLYLAIISMATSAAPLPERVATAFRLHLGSLNSQNTPVQVYARLRVIRGRLAQLAVDDLDEDETIDVLPMTISEAAQIAEELISLYDEIARQNAESTADS